MGRAQFSSSLAPRGSAKPRCLPMLSRTATTEAAWSSRRTGVPSETNLPFAGLHQLLVHVLHVVDNRPPRERETVRAALGLAEGPGLDLYRVALAVLELPSALA